MKVMLNSKVMDIKMNKVIEGRKKKTRRGRKRRALPNFQNDHFTENVFEGNYESCDVLSTSYRYHPYQSRLHSTGNVAKCGIRPISPKAPHNSTQFLIEDGGNGIDIDSYFANMPAISSSPETLSDYEEMRTEMLPYHSLEQADFIETEDSFYEDFTEKSKLQHYGSDNDCEYTPINREETIDFISQEFEREYNLMANEKLHTKREELLSEPKDSLIQKILKMEEITRKLKSRKSAKKVDRLSSKIDHLQQENNLYKRLLNNLASL